MIRGLYAAASAMAAQMLRQEIYAHNLANANAPGFRRSQLALHSFAAELAAAAPQLGRATGGVRTTATRLDLSQGALLTTQGKYDLAISGDGFFVLQTPTGLVYTRDGRFQRDAAGRLVSRQGYPLLGEKGPIVLPAADFTVTAAGEIHCQGQIVDRLRLVVPLNPRPLGYGMYGATRVQPASGSTITQGALEQANVNPIQELGRMMQGLRFYEANATALRYQDESLESLWRIVR